MRQTTMAWLMLALKTGTLNLLPLEIGARKWDKIEHVARIEREDGSGSSFNVYTLDWDSIPSTSFYVRTVD